MNDFLTTTKTNPPAIPPFWFTVMILVLAVCAYGVIKYHQNSAFVRIFKAIQIMQLLFLYSWYIAYAIPISNSLPLYHCRLAMLAVLFLPDKTSFKQYFALLGASGAVFALVYPVFDPYTFPHITSISFLIGHYALLVNSLVYLMNHFDKNLLKTSMIVVYTFVIDLFLVAVNTVTGGNYGLMSQPPIIKGDSILVNYLLVSSILAVALVLFDELFKWQRKRKERAS